MGKLGRGVRRAVGGREGLRRCLGFGDKCREKAAGVDHGGELNLGIHCKCLCCEV